TGLAATYLVLLLTRSLVGVGEAAYGPAAPTIIADWYPSERRGQVLAWLYMAIPVGSALGYAFGGWVSSHWNWRDAFYASVGPGTSCDGATAARTFWCRAWGCSSACRCFCWCSSRRFLQRGC